MDFERFDQIFSWVDKIGLGDWNLENLVNFGNGENQDDEIGNAGENFVQLTEYSDVLVLDEESAKEALLDMRDSIGFATMDEFCDPVKKETNFYTYYEFLQSCNGVPVYGKSITIGARKNGKICSVSGNYSELGSDFLEDLILQQYVTGEIHSYEDCVEGNGTEHPTGNPSVWMEPIPEHMNIAIL